MKMIHDTYSSLDANLWDIAIGSLISIREGGFSDQYQSKLAHVWIPLPDANDVFAVMVQNRSWLPVLLPLASCTPTLHP